MTQKVERDQDVFKPERYPKLQFSESDWNWFTNICAEFEFEVDDQKRTHLEAIYSHLVGVNEWMNLTRLTTPLDFLRLHILDSLTAIDEIEEFTDEGEICLDLGSGGGYPGLPLMTWLPQRKWILADSRQKKVSFLKEAVKLTGCQSAEAYSFRGREAATAVPHLAGKCRIVTARAVGRADLLMAEAAPLLRKGGYLTVLKGPAYATDEREAVEKCCEKLGYEMFLERIITLDDDVERTIVTLIYIGKPEQEQKKSKSKKKNRRKRR